MPETLIPSDPVLTLEETRAFEAKLFGDDERRTWKAMVLAGRSVAAAILRDITEAGGFPGAGRVLVLAGKGNNAGDALIAAREILERNPKAAADVLFAFGPRKLGPAAAKAWRGLSDSCPGRVRSVGGDGLQPAYDLCIDGIFGYRFRTPLPPEVLAAVAGAARCSIRFNAAVDLPSGLDEAGAFRGDFTYATGSVKAPLLTSLNAGRVRYLDLGFFRDAAERPSKGGAGDRVILPSVLAPLAGLRAASSDKRSQGHLAIVGGSAGFPGAVLMTTLAALRSGVGLVTVFVPERLVPSFAARAPEAMWVGLPENAEGALAPEGLEKVLKGLSRATALAIGPGLGRDPGTSTLVLDIVTAAAVPLVIDADALQPDVVRTGTAPRILTPHAGELARISNGADLRSLCTALSAVVVAKGPSTKICAGGETYHSLFGGPVLSRGGSGDLLAGLTGGLLAQTPSEPLLAACRATVWHGMAADQLARSEGQAAVRVTQLLDFLAPALLEAAGIAK